MGKKKTIDRVTFQLEITLDREDFNLMEATRTHERMTMQEFYSQLITGFCNSIKQVNAEIIKEM